ncbi:MAG TPA: hypothetical protein VLM91_05095 [Candidatus Methylomirabilis sp.]|nr:hypothetical protein [Candidatus Methylomirabilis sp.]
MIPVSRKPVALIVGAPGGIGPELGRRPSPLSRHLALAAWTKEFLGRLTAEN